MRKRKKKVTIVEIQKIVIRDGVVTKFIPGSNGLGIEENRKLG